jgi:uncharacterized protein (TIRG00374 family)
MWRLLLSFGVLLLCVLLFRQIEWRRVWASLQQADWRLIVIAVALNLTLNLAARTLRWATLVERLPHSGRGARTLELCALLIASYASSNVLPGRAGEALRTFELNRRHNYPVAALIAAQLIEKVIEGLSMAAIAFVVLILARPSRSLWAPVLGLAALGVIGTAIVIAVATSFRRWGGGARPLLGPATTADEANAAVQHNTLRTRLRARARAFFHRLGEAVHLMHAPSVWQRTLLFSFVSDFVDVGMLGLCLYGVGIHVGPVGWLLAFLTVNLAIVVPSTPGQIGVHEAGTVLALSALGIEPNVALAGALIYHAVHVVPTTVIGLICLRTQFLREDAPSVGA